MGVRTFFFEPDTLLPLAESRREEFAGAEPFPHIVIDHLVPDDVLEEVLKEFPEPEDDRWFRFEHAKSRKLAMHEDWSFGPSTRQLLSELNSAVFVKFLESLTSIDGLIPDPKLHGGGLHQIEPGGFLKIHTDFNFHKTWNLDRRINVLVYLNRGWEENWGGNLELWNDAMTECRAISPLFNRTVIFATTDTSKHGHPDPLRCPPGETRRSLALYYYSNGRPEAEQTISHQTLHFERPGEVLEGGARSTSRAKTMVQQLVPPVAVRAAARVKARISSRKAGSD
jgi:2OG-Fe(II) oxygenase superfamily